jgi:ribonuclease HII
MLRDMPITVPTFEIEERLGEGLSGPVAGVDEAGRGAWAGPVVAAAVILNPHCTPAGLRDSKTLAEKRRETLAAAIWSCARVGVGKATYLAMQRAVAGLPLRPAGALIDGLYAPILPGCQTVTVVKGDSRSVSIAAASIVAKVTRDRIMRRLSDAFDAYGWDRNKGYGAQLHQDALARHGICEHHRRSFAPIRKLIEDAQRPAPEPAVLCA